MNIKFHFCQVCRARCQQILHTAPLNDYFCFAHLAYLSFTMGPLTLRTQKCKHMNKHVIYTAMHRSSRAYDAVLVSDLPVSEHDRLFALICV